jgi:hypothetical protein
MASVDLDKLMRVKQGVFWILLDASLGLCGVMFLLFLFNTFAIKDRLFPSSGIMANLRSLSDTLLTIPGNVFSSR